MANDPPPFPPSGSYVKSIRESSRILREDAGININPGDIQRLLLSPSFTTSFKRVSAVHGLAFPLKFQSAVCELNLLSVLSLLNFASGYRVPLHKETGRGAWDNIRLLLFSMYLTSLTGEESELLTAKGMQTIQEQQVAELLRVSLHVERPHETIPGVTVGELGGPMHELVTLITRTLNETGEVLVNSGYKDMGSFMVEALKEGEKKKSANTPGADIEVVLERIVRAFPAFRDMATVNGKPVYCFKKALFLIHAITVRFGSTSPAPFPIPDTSTIPVFTDNVLPSLLIHLGVIDLSSSNSGLSKIFPDAKKQETLDALLAEAPPKSESDKEDSKTKPLPVEGPILTFDQSYILRAAAIDACELIIETAHSEDLQTKDLGWIKEITLPGLDMWLWSVAKDRADYRRLERFVSKNTVFF